MHNQLSFIVAATVLTGLCDAICDPTSFDVLPTASVPTWWRTKPIEIINRGNNSYLCRYFDCRVISHESLASRLPGTFFKVSEYSIKSGLRYVPMRPRSKRSGNDDFNPCTVPELVSNGDYCCPTTRYFTCYETPTCIYNVNAQPFNVFALPDTFQTGRFQCVTRSACCGGGTCSYGQGGRSCKLEDSMQSLFVWHEPSGKLQFEMFPFPASCTCKSN